MHYDKNIISHTIIPIGMDPYIWGHICNIIVFNREIYIIANYWDKTLLKNIVIFISNFVYTHMPPYPWV